MVPSPVWSSLGNGLFSATTVAFRYAPDSEFAFKVYVRDTCQLPSQFSAVLPLGRRPNDNQDLIEPSFAKRQTGNLRWLLLCDSFMDRVCAAAGFFEICSKPIQTESLRFPWIQHLHSCVCKVADVA